MFNRKLREMAETVYGVEPCDKVLPVNAQYASRNRGHLVLFF